MSRLLISVLSLFTILVLAGCAAMGPKLEDPNVKLVGIRLLPSQGLQQSIAVDLLIGNPNARDLSVRGMTYKIGVENINFLDGMTDQVPVLKSYQETPVTLEVSADVLQIIRLLEHFHRKGVSDTVNYNFSAAIDFSAWLPTMHVNKKGVIPLSGKTN